jgi:hypothetical protein
LEVAIFVEIMVSLFIWLSSILQVSIAKLTFLVLQVTFEATWSVEGLDGE